MFLEEGASLTGLTGLESGRSGVPGLGLLPRCLQLGLGEGGDGCAHALSAPNTEMERCYLGGLSFDL